MSNPRNSNLARRGTSNSISRRPHTIAELADLAKLSNWDGSIGLKHWLRTAEKSRKNGEELAEKCEYEHAFIELAKAATIVLEKIPTHAQYRDVLNPEQRSNLSKNGQDILDALGRLKPILMQQYDDWQANHPSSSRSSSSEPPTRSDPREEASRRRREDQLRAQEEERARHAQDAMRREQEWRREESARRQAEERDRRTRDEAAWSRQSNEVKRREQVAAAAEARRAAEARELAEHERNARVRREEADALQSEEERVKRRLEDKRRREQDGIARRQQEADAAARAARRDIVYQIPASPGPGSSQTPLSLTPGGQAIEAARAAARSGPSMPVAAPIPSRPSIPGQNSVFPDSAFQDAYAPPRMPIESPSKYDDDTDVEGTGERRAPWMRNRQPVYNELTPSRTRPLNGIVYPAPVTTTSPAPPEGAIRYPSLMSQHQLKQGYVPSLQSMFSHSPEPPPPTASLLFDAKGGGLYENILPQPAGPVIPYPPPQPAPSQPQPQPRPNPNQYNAHPYSNVGQRGPSPSGARPPPPIPPKEAVSAPPTSSTFNTQRIVPGGSKDANIRELKSVRLPRECLPKFLSIARVNTLQNRETCGLLLGKDKGSKFVITTLLIPKQRSTSDTCTMDEEELVLQFTEERHLITLGWIHTHPTQSCFMSSVDLHTHSGFQRMLPESFAVVCAPTSTPTFGIFRLTDPGGLQTILECTAKEAFHPHPEVPIYTLTANNRRRKDFYTLPKEDQDLLAELGYKDKLNQVDKAIAANAEFLNQIIADPAIFGHDVDSEDDDASEHPSENPLSSSDGPSGGSRARSSSHEHPHSHPHGHDGHGHSHAHGEPHSHSHGNHDGPRGGHTHSGHHASDAHGHSHDHDTAHGLGGTGQPGKRKKYRPTDFDMDKLRSTIKQFVRDWSQEGKAERDLCYEPIKDALLAHFSDKSPEERGKLRVLVPGAGLGRLAWDVAALGFACQGNEFSHYMLLSSFFVLNRDRPGILRPVTLPDVSPSSLPPGSNFSLVAGDFEEIYGSEHDEDEPQAGEWDAILTCFFIDTAKNVVNYLRVIHRILAPGGVWINLGPLLWHFENNSTNDPSIELDLEEVKVLARKIGFEISNERTIDTTYTNNTESMLGYIYHAQFWTATKIAPP